MKIKLVVLFGMILATVVATPAQGWDIYCATYWDSQPGGDGWGNTWCELSGSVCYHCWEETFGYNCAAEARCSPIPLLDVPQTAMRIYVDKVTGDPFVAVCRATTENELNRNVTTLL